RAHGLYFARRSVLVVMDKASAGWQIHTSRADVDAFFTAHRQYQGADPEQVPYSFRYIKPGTLAVPFRDIDRKLWSVQLIFPSGTKSFFRGSRKQATFHLLGTAPRASKRRKTVWMAEGYATAATVHELTQCPTVMAIDAGNLLPVAKAVRKLWPAVDIAFAADNDADKPGNPGVTAATAAAQAVGGYVVVPKIGE
ncbi:MAG: hypothetical protein CMK32_03845, partial [Porticoccaceae bacterium]|nr:hypothetical protein [Porticoccaceae bacterium]